MDGVIQQIHAISKQAYDFLKKYKIPVPVFFVCVFDMLLIEKIIAVKIIAPEN